MIKIPKFDNSWCRNVKIPVIQPKKLTSVKDVTFVFANGYQVVDPYYKEMIVKVANSKHKTPMNYLYEQFMSAEDMRHSIYNAPQERDKHYWDQLKTQQLIKLQVDRKFDTLTDFMQTGLVRSKKQKYKLEFKGDSLDLCNLKPSDLISTVNCIHELPVPAVKDSKIDIIYQDADLLVVDKPFGIPVHPTGNSYRYNSVISMIQSQLQLEEPIYPCHRLDKDTTGLLILAKNASTCGQMSEMISDKSFMSKEYLVQLHGRFPEVLDVSNDVLHIDVTKKSAVPHSLQPQEAHTIFRRVEYNEDTDTSLVVAQLLTGRKHQIRQHLSMHNYHIVNDPLYGREGILSDLLHTRFDMKKLNMAKARHQEMMQNKLNLAEPLNICGDCGHITYISAQTPDPMRLHSFRYISKEGKLHYESKLPSWAE